MAKIAVLVCNACAPDHRVNKQAEFLASRGHHVRIYCRSSPNLPDYEVVHGVEYIRIKFGIGDAAKQLFSFRQKKLNIDIPALARQTDQSPNTSNLTGTSANSSEPKTISKPGALKHGYRMAKLQAIRFATIGFNILVYPFSKALIHLAFATVYRPYLVDWNPDIIHAHDLYTLPAAVQTAQSTGSKVIYDTHELETHRNPPPPFHVQKAISWIEKRYIAKADSVITVCDPIADYLRDQYQIPRPYVVMNTPEYPRPTGRKGDFLLEDTKFEPEEEHWRYSAENSDRLRDLIDVPDGKFIAIYVGLVTINRGVETVVEALQKVPEMVLVTVGPTNPNTVKKLKALALEKGVGDRFILLPRVPATQVVDFIADADFGVCPIWPVTQSYDWSLPNKLFEMTFAGLPIVASNTQEVSRFLKSNDLGLIYQYDDAAQCADKIKTLLGNFENYRPSKGKITKVREAYAWQKQTKIVTEVYDQYLAG